MRIKQQQNTSKDNTSNTSGSTYHHSSNTVDVDNTTSQVFNLGDDQYDAPSPNPYINVIANTPLQPNTSDTGYRRQAGLLRKLKNICRNIIREPIIIIAIIIITFLIMFVRPFLVPSGSMVPTLQEGDRILSIAQYFQDGHTYKVGDIVCFYTDDGTVYVKRVIATGGDLVEISGEKVYVNGELSSYQGTGGQVTSLRVQLADDEYFVMGDNRGNSEDSRFIGPIKASQMISKVICIYYPFEHFTIF